MATHKQAQAQPPQMITIIKEAVDQGLSVVFSNNVYHVPPENILHDAGVDCRYDNYTGACILPLKPCTMIEYKGEFFRYAFIRNY